VCVCVCVQVAVVVTEIWTNSPPPLPGRPYSAPVIASTPTPTHPRSVLSCDAAGFSVPRRSTLQDSEQEDTYCTAMCQEGVNRVSWHAHGAAYCAKSPGSCSPRPTVVPMAEYVVGSWSAPPHRRMTCEVPEGGIPKFTVGMLARKETESLVNTLRTFEQEGLLQVQSASCIGCFDVF
jgi:hypothetical protein